MSEFAELMYSVFALQQPMTLEEITSVTDGHTLLMSHAQTPEWFAAAASLKSSLPDMAPELSASHRNSPSVDGIDLVWLYAPELQELEREDDAAQDVGAHVRGDDISPDQRVASVQIGLLRELLDFDA